MSINSSLSVEDFVSFHVSRRLAGACAEAGAAKKERPVGEGGLQVAAWNNSSVPCTAVTLFFCGHSCQKGGSRLIDRDPSQHSLARSGEFELQYNILAYLNLSLNFGRGQVEGREAEVAWSVKI